MMKTPLFRYTVSGIKCLEKPLVFSFLNATLPTDRKVNLANSNVKAIYGGNGVGKSAAITGMSVLKQLLWSSNYLIRRGKDLYHLINKKTKTASLSVVFGLQSEDRIQAMLEYEIQLAADDADKSVEIVKQVMNRYITRSINGPKKTLFLCEGSSVSFYEQKQVEVVDWLNKVSQNLTSRSCLNTVIADASFKERDNEELMANLRKSAVYSACLGASVFASQLRVWLNQEDIHH